MSDHLRTELARMLDSFDEQRRAVLAREQKLKDDGARFLAQFVELRRSVIRPAFETAAALLGERGHTASVAEQEFSIDPASKVTEAGISLEIVPAGAEARSRAEVVRTLSFTTRHYTKTVSINAGRPLEGAKGSYALERLNEQLVEEELLRFIGDVVAR